ncbi:MAG: hypothetical protein IPF87_20095 [Gemmatimonadetes bacterium]|nr:hypothetical protein [Gemmatimonadota bacterium]
MARIAWPERLEPFLPRDTRQALEAGGAIIAAIDHDVRGGAAEVPGVARPGNDGPLRGAPLRKERVLALLRAHRLDDFDGVAVLLLHPVDHAIQALPQLGDEGLDLAPHRERIARHRGRDPRQPRLVLRTFVASRQRQRGMRGGRRR